MDLCKLSPDFPDFLQLFSRVGLKLNRIVSIAHEISVIEAVREA